MSTDKALVDGKIVDFADARMHVVSPSIQYATAVFEGIRAYWSPQKEQLSFFRYQEHIDRLHLSMKMMRLDPPAALANLKADVISLARANELREDCHMRVFVLLDGPPVITATGPTRLAATIGALPFNSFMEKGMKAGVVSWRRNDDNACPPRMKTVANYVNGRLAAIEAKQNGFDAPVMLTAEGYVSEGPQANILLVRDGELLAPRRTDGILESITRDTIMRLCEEELGIPVVERAIDRSELYAADEMFYCGSGWEIRPATRVDGLPVGDGNVGPVTRRIAEAYFAAVRGENARYADWLVPVW